MRICTVPCSFSPLLGGPPLASVHPPALQRYAVSDCVCDDAEVAVSFTQPAGETRHVVWLECMDSQPAYGGSWQDFALLVSSYVSCRHERRTEECNDHVQPISPVFAAEFVGPYTIESISVLQQRFSAVLSGQLDPSVLEGQCYYGAVAAMFVRFLHQATGEFHEAGVQLGKIASHLLGGKSLLLDVLESTWTWRWLHGVLVEQTLELVKARGSDARAYGENGFLLPFFRFEKGIPWILEDFAALSLYTPFLGPFGVPEANEAASRFRGSVEGFTLSQHTGVLLHGVSLLAAALPRVAESAHVRALVGINTHVGIQAAQPTEERTTEPGAAGGVPSWYGSWYARILCDVVGVCDAQGMDPEVAAYDDVIRVADALGATFEYAAAVAALRPLTDRLPGLNGGIVLCSTARECLVAAEAFPAARLLMWMLAPPFRRARIGEPVGPTEALEVFFFKELVRSGRGLAFVSSEKLGADVQYIAGIQPPVLLPTAIFALQHRAVAARPEVLLSGRLFLLRSPWKRLLPELAPKWTFLSQAETTLSYETLGAFYACAFFPWGLHALAFMEIYGLHVPLFVPTAELLLKVERVGSFPDQIAEVFDTRDRDFPIGMELLGPAPFWAKDVRAPVQQVAFWWKYSFMVRLPHVSEFASIPELVHQLAALDRGAVVRSMRAAHGDLSVAAVTLLARGLRDLIRQRPAGTSGARDS